MKKLFSIFLAVTVLLGSLLAIPVGADTSAPNKTPDLSIGTNAELKAFLTSTDDYAGKLVVLTADIDMNGEGYDIVQRAFAGTFDGQGHTITNWCANNNVAHGYGLFGYVEKDKTATVKNLVIRNSTYRNLKWQVGGLFGEVHGTVNIENVYSELNMGGDWGNAGDLGGFIGKVNATANVTFQNCVYAGTINNANQKGANCGGFIGTTTAGCTITIKNCAMYGKILYSIANTVAGFVPIINGSLTVSNSIFAGNVADHANSGMQYSFYAGGAGAKGIAKCLTVLADGFTTKKVDGSTTVADLSQATLDANGLIGWTVTADNKCLPSAATVVRGYQTTAKDASSNTFKLRFVATLRASEAALKNIDTVGFKVTATYTDVNGKQSRNIDKQFTTVYTEILAADAGETDNITAKSLFGDDTEGYIFTLSMWNVPANVGEITFTVTPCYNNGTEVQDTTVTFTVDTNDLPAANMSK